MNSKSLIKAREYELQEEAKVNVSDRAAFHLTPRIGWMNDPNGFSFYKGKYHLFYQYYPYDTSLGPMHWGHACTEDGSGAILLFQSPDVKQWEYVTTLDRSDNKYGKMWECPDFFSLNDTQVLLVSPQEMRAQKLEFHNGNNSICLLGSYNKKKHKFERESVQSVDQGLDFYAPQTVETPDGRRILIGWMQSWESSRNQPHDNKFFGTMSVPRELSIKDGRLLQKPVKELEKYRDNRVSYQGVTFKEPMQLDGINGRILDMDICLQMPEATTNDVVTIAFAKDHENETIIQYFPYSGILRFDRNNCGFDCDILNVRDVETTPYKLKLRILLDRYSSEIFLNEGERVLSNTFYTPIQATDITFQATSEAYMDITKWDLML